MEELRDAHILQPSCGFGNLASEMVARTISEQWDAITLSSFSDSGSSQLTYNQQSNRCIWLSSFSTERKKKIICSRATNPGIDWWQIWRIIAQLSNCDALVSRRDKRPTLSTIKCGREYKKMELAQKLNQSAPKNKARMEESTAPTNFLICIFLILQCVFLHFCTPYFSARNWLWSLTSRPSNKAGEEEPTVEPLDQTAMQPPPREP